MKKQHTILIPLVAIGVVLFVGYEGFGWKSYINEFTNELTIGTIGTVTTDPVAEEAWQVLEEYMGYAKAHDLEGVKKLSAQISATCADETKREECYALMDSVYVFFSYFKQGDFKNVLSDGSKIILFTDYHDGVRVAYYFTRDTSNNIKVAGMKFCEGSSATPDPCSSF